MVRAQVNRYGWTRFEGKGLRIQSLELAVVVCSMWYVAGGMWYVICRSSLSARGHLPVDR